MSRMYSMVSGGASVRAVVPGPDTSAPARGGQPRTYPAEVSEEFVSDAEDTPYVEIGGPGGPVFSAGPVSVTLPTTNSATTGGLVGVIPSGVPETSPLAASSRATASPEPVVRPFPRLADAAPYLSVRFHDLSGRPRGKPEYEGPDPGLVALHLPDHPISSEYRTLRDEVRSQLPDPTPRVLFFTAAIGEAGTSTVLLNLAVTVARENGPRVLVVDANIARPAAAPRLALKPGPGLVEVLAQQVPLAWAVQASVVPNLQVLPAGGSAGTEPPALGQDLPKLLDQLRHWYDWIFVDAGVWGMIPDRDSACPAADAVYLVTREADVDRSEFTGLRGWVRELGGLLRGYIATRG